MILQLVEAIMKPAPYFSYETKGVEANPSIAALNENNIDRLPVVAHIMSGNFVTSMLKYFSIVSGSFRK